MSSKSLNLSELSLRIEIDPEHTNSSFDKIFFKLKSGEEFQVENSLKFQLDGVVSESDTIGIKESGNTDFAVVKFDKPVVSSAVFTKNLCPSFTVADGRRVVEKNDIKLLAVVSGNAIVFSPRGEESVAVIKEALSASYQVGVDQILLSATGKIGFPLDNHLVGDNIKNRAVDLKENNLDSLAAGILTTDLGAKSASVKIGNTVIAAACKGAGMIEPNMATMLCYVFTNYKLTKSQIDEALSFAVKNSFNAISIDHDTSTNDTTALFSTSEVEDISFEDFKIALRAICVKLARDMVSQGEGVTKLIDCLVKSPSEKASKNIGKSIINSPLMKSAIYGGDPNWGRIVMSVGKTWDVGLEEYSVDDIRLGLAVYIQDVCVYDRGVVLDINFDALAAELKFNKNVAIRVELLNMMSSFRVWGSDLTEEYVKINALYTT